MSIHKDKPKKSENIDDVMLMQYLYQEILKVVQNKPGEAPTMEEMTTIKDLCDRILPHHGTKGSSQSAFML
jgi:hypothetical protein